MTPNAAVQTERMTISRIFDAPRELVWKAWTDPEYVKRWWGPKGFTTPVCQMDFRVGGKYLRCMKSPEGQEFWGGGEYLEIIPNERIVFSMYFTDPQGNKVEAGDYGIGHEALDNENDTVLFEDLGNGQTRMTYIGNETMQNAMETGQLEGMKQILDKLTEVLTEMSQKN